jgi:hypothetical protein
MALRTKTIEHAWPGNRGPVASGVMLTNATNTLYIPETASRTFLSVLLEITLMDSHTAAPAPTSWAIGIKLGSVGNDSVTTTKTLTAGDSARDFTFVRDVTAYFVANFGSGASQTCQTYFTLTGAIRANTNVKLYITYRFDDTAQTTRVKTVRLPLADSPTGYLTTTSATIATIPALNTFLPEASKTFRCIWLEYTAHEGTYAAVATDFQYGFNLNADAEIPDGLHSSVTMKPRTFRLNYVIAPDTSVTHAVKGRVTVANHVLAINVVLYVTYEYNHSTSTSVMNSLIVPLGQSHSWLDGDTAPTRMQAKFMVEEPATLALSYSAVVIRAYYYSGNNIGIKIAVGGQAQRTYANLSYTGDEIAPLVLLHRFDSGGVSGSGHTLARGENTIVLDLRRVQVINHQTFFAYAMVNYTSGIASSGADSHAHTVFQAGVPPTSAYEMPSASHALIDIADADWYMSCAAMFIFGYPHTAEATAWVALDTEIKSGERGGDGWAALGVGAATAGGTQATVYSMPLIGDTFTRWPGDSGSDRLDTLAARIFRLSSAPLAMPFWGAYALCTYHAIKFTVAGTVTGFTGDGSGITVTLYRADTGEKLATTTTAVGGGYSFTWYDNTIQVFTEARQDGTHVGRSDLGYAA